MVGKKRLTTKDDFINCWALQLDIDIEHKDEDVIIDSGKIEQNEFPHYIVLNGKTYNINDFLFFY
ncbi:hypothetical protein ACFQ3W_23430 [Paenibacillus puldeungensis]|uniref:Uncharacterized protein n=1 Tax=Paenibacillus puldeungensis TaxID=696536 RepID=A0ABW3S5I8_9BACL